MQAQPFSNCSQAEAAGAAPIYAGQPGYSRKLDRDGDGIACDAGSGSGYVPQVPSVPAPPAVIAPPVVVAPEAEAAPDTASGAGTPVETCTDWMKLRIDPATGQEQVCGPINSPAIVYYWIPPQPMPGGVHDAGAPCPGVAPYTYARSTDNYQIWCATGRALPLPGGRAIDAQQPTWSLYSP